MAHSIPSPSVTCRLAQLSDADMRLLKVFKAVADCGGLSAAGLELNIGVSTVSRHVKDLEIRLGLVLCRRGRAGFGLTPEGQRVYDETARLLGAVDVFRGSIDDIHQQMGGQLEVGIFDKVASNPEAAIGQAVSGFVARAPGVALRIQVNTIAAIERGVLDGSLHLGIIPAHRASPAFTYDDLFGETMLLYCGASHPLHGADNRRLGWKALQRYRFAGLGYHSPNMELSHREGLQRAATGLDQESIAILVLSGQFLGFLPNHYGDGFVQTGQMRPVNPETLRYDCRFQCILRRSPAASRAALAMREQLLLAHGRPAALP